MNMAKQHLGLAAVVAVLALVAIWAGAPANTVLLIALVLACPLMMLLMMGSMHDSDSRHDSHHHGPSDHAPSGDDATQRRPTNTTRR